jgi:hypothetical protein
MPRQASNQSERIAVYNAKVTAIPGLERSMGAGRFAELAALVEMTIGPVGEAVLTRLLEIQNELQTADSSAAALLDTGKITSEQYVDLLDKNMRAAMERNRQVLGDERCKALFGPAADDPSVPVEEKAIFFEKAQRIR